MSYTQVGVNQLNGDLDHMEKNYKVVQRGEHYGLVEGLAGSGYKPGYIGKLAADSATSDLYTFDAATYGDEPTVIFEWDRMENDDHDDQGADGDDVYVVPINEISFARVWYKDNVSLAPGDKLTISATAGCLDKQVDSTLSNDSEAFGFTSSTADNTANGPSLPNYTIGLSWTSVASVASRAAVPILMQVMRSP